MNIAICDDNEAFVEELDKNISSILKKQGMAFSAEKFYSGKDLINRSRNTIYDIILLDIDMPEKTGFNTVEEIYIKQPNVFVVFITAHEEFAYQAYDYHPYQFVNKSDLEKLPRVIATLCDKIAARRQYHDVVHIDLGCLIDINIKEVVYIKSEKNYVMIFDANGSARKYRGKIRNVYMQLKEYGFIFPQRSYVVNCRYIIDFDRKEIALKNGELISVSRDDDVRKEAQHLYGKHMRSIRW